MRIVLDTNVLVSGLLSPLGPPGRILDLIISGALTLLHDDRLLAEYRTVLRRPRFGFAPADVEALLAFLRAEGEPVPSPPLDVVLPDLDDLPFLEVAVAGCAEALVTGNQVHFPPDQVPAGLRVVSPAEFLALYRSAMATRAR
jgi:putative PIN family toxin of toxin-antitoxin system